MKRILFFIAAMALPSTPLFAQTASGGVEIFAETASWQIALDGNECILRNRASTGRPMLVLRRSVRSDIDLLIELPHRFDFEELRWSLGMRMDNYSERLGLTDQGRRLQVIGLGADFAAAFVRSYSLDVVSGGETHFVIDLAGSATAYRAFERCAGGLSEPRTQPTLPPPPRRLVPEPDLTPPLPPSRSVTPISMTRWITGDDFPSHMDGEGRVGFRVTVTPQGRAQDCEITESSADLRLDEITCRLIERRARFDPATDARGNPVASTWESAALWRMPQ